MKSASVPHFCAYDGNGNVMGLVQGPDGARTAAYEYDPFGRTIRITGPQARNNPFRFSTKRANDTSDLVLYEYRAYNPDTGRWLSRDPIGERGGLNLSGFVDNDPLNRFDPLGLYPAKDDCYKECDDKYGRSGVGGARAYAACISDCNSKHPPEGFSICQRDIQKDCALDCVTGFANLVGGEHSYVGYVDSDGHEWGWGFGQPGTAEELHFKPNSCKPCKKTGDAVNKTDAEIRDCIAAVPPSKPYARLGYNCHAWAEEAAKKCGLECK